MKRTLLLIFMFQLFTFGDETPEVCNCFNFCITHLQKYPEACHVYDYEIPCSTQILRQIPSNNSTCAFQFCKRCKSPVHYYLIVSEFDDGEEKYYDDDEAYGLFFKCNCLDDWISEAEAEEFQFELDDDEEFSSYLSSYWKPCHNKAIPSSFIKVHNQMQQKQLEALINYAKSNACECYWPYKHPLSAKISNLAYTKLDPIIRNSFVYFNNDPSAIKQTFPYFENITLHGLVLDCLAQAFFYSQYRHSLLQWGLWDEQYNSDNDKVVANLDGLYNIIDQISPLFINLYSDCLKLHPHPKIYYERGMVLFHQGHYLDALKDMKVFTTHPTSDKNTILDSNYYLNEGTIYAELGQYEKAVESLSLAIKKNPSNKEAYFERASSYFELGDLDACFSDYLTSDMRPSFDTNPSSQNLDYWMGLTQGLVQGGSIGVIEYIPSLLSTACGLGQGLWAFAENPLQVSSEFIDTTKQIIQYIKEHTSEEALELLVPEMKELLKKWDSIEDKEQGRLVGYLIGKYSVDIAASAGIAKGIKVYKDLKKANNLLTFESMALSKRNYEILKLEALKKKQIRKDILKSANLNIEGDKQGKHIKGHKFFEPLKNRSILEHKDPQMLVKNFAGKGMKECGVPGQAGYKEIIDFGENIGAYFNRETKQYIPTNWGKIHYSKSGTHIVPTKPR